MHLIGQHLLGALVEEFEDMEEMEEEMLDEEEGDDSQFKVCSCTQTLCYQYYSLGLFHIVVHVD